MEYRLDLDNVVTSGLLSAPVDGQTLQWDPHTRQAVHLLPSLVDVDPTSGTSWNLRHRVVFKPRSGDFDFEFSLTPMIEEDEVRID
jgi:hypothetical protein